jgi:hypothetical protein
MPRNISTGWCDWREEGDVDVHNTNTSDTRKLKCSWVVNIAKAEMVFMENSSGRGKN